MAPSVEFGVKRIDRILLGGACQKPTFKVQVTSPASRGFIRLHGYSHSMVPVGFGVRSYSTRFTPGTSVTMRLVMWCNSA